MFLMLIRRDADGYYRQYGGTFSPSRQYAALVESDGNGCDTLVPAGCSLVPFHGDRDENPSAEDGPGGGHVPPPPGTVREGV